MSGDRITGLVFSPTFFIWDINEDYPLIRSPLDPSTSWDIQAVLPPLKIGQHWPPKRGEVVFTSTNSIGPMSRLVPPPKWCENGSLHHKMEVCGLKSLNSPLPKKFQMYFQQILNLHLPSNKLGRRPNLKRSTSSDYLRRIVRGISEECILEAHFRISFLVGG